MTEHQIQWFVDNFTEGRDRILFLLDREERIAEYTLEEIYRACVEIMKVPVGRISLEGLLYKMSELSYMGVSASKAGQILHELLKDIK
jgi:hypothetical protein